MGKPHRTSAVDAARHPGAWAIASLHHPNADRCVVNIPDTVIFKNGTPQTWVFTSKRGEVMRKRQTNPSAILARFRANTSCILRHHGTESPHEVHVDELHNVLKATPTNLAALQVPIQSKAGAATIFRNEYTLRDAERHVTFNTFQMVNWTKPEDKPHSSAAIPKLDPVMRCKNKHVSDQLDTCTQRMVNFLEKTQKCKILRLIAEYMLDEDDVPWLLWIPEVLTFDGVAASDLLNSGLKSRSTRTKGWSNNELQEQAFDNLDETVHQTIAHASQRLTNQPRRRAGSTGDHNNNNNNGAGSPGDGSVDGPQEDPQEFARQLGNAAQHLRGRSNLQRSTDFRARQQVERQQSNSPALRPKHQRGGQTNKGSGGSVSASTSALLSHKSKMPSPYRCMGDFCDFTIEDPDGLADTNVQSGQVNVAIEPSQRGTVLNPHRPGVKPAHNPAGSVGLVTRILSSYESQALQSSPDFFRDLTHMMQTQDEDSKMYSVTRKSIVLARQERRRGAKAPQPNEEPGHRFMRATHSRLRYENHEATTGGSTIGEGLNHATYYERQNVCKSCFLVYTTLDRAREALKV